VPQEAKARKTERQREKETHTEKAFLPFSCLLIHPWGTHTMEEDTMGKEVEEEEEKEAENFLRKLGLW